MSMSMLRRKPSRIQIMSTVSRSMKPTTVKRVGNHEASTKPKAAAKMSPIELIALSL